MSWHHHTFRFTRGPSGSDEIPDKDADRELSDVLHSKNNELAVAFFTGLGIGFKMCVRCSEMQPELPWYIGCSMFLVCFVRFLISED